MNTQRLLLVEVMILLAVAYDATAPQTHGRQYVHAAIDRGRYTDARSGTILTGLVAQLARARP